MAAKYTSDESDEIDKPASLTVLSWNIHGKCDKGMADARKEMLKNKISSFNPDVMLLQETKTKIDTFFEDVGIKNKKDYKYPEGAINNKEARVIFKTSEFEEVKESLVNKGIPDTILEKAFPRYETVETRSGQKGGRETIKERTCVVHLRHKPSSCNIIFVSFHNIYYGKYSTDMASKFCKIIAYIHESSGCCVIAGVDFNTNDFKSKDVKVPYYEETPRRKLKKKIDYFIVSESTVNWKVESVESVDLFPEDNDASLHKNLQNRLVLSDEDKDTYNKALDHDPLVLQLEKKKNKKKKEEEEDEGESDKEKKPDLSVLSLKAVKTEGDGGSIISPPQEEEEDDEGESEKENVKKEKLLTRLKTN